MCSPLTLLSVKLPTYPQMYRLEGSYFYIVIKLLMFVYRSPNRRPPEEVEWREYVVNKCSPEVSTIYSFFYLLSLHLYFLTDFDAAHHPRRLYIFIQPHLS